MEDLRDTPPLTDGGEEILTQMAGAQSRDNLLSIVVGIVCLVLVLAGLVAAVVVEQNHRQQTAVLPGIEKSRVVNQQDNFPTLEPTADSPVTPTPSVTHAYEPQTSLLSHDEAVGSFLAAAVNFDTWGTNHRLVRWNKPQVTWDLLGNRNDEDLQCITEIFDQINAVTETTKFVAAKTGEADISIFALPKSQFAVANPHVQPGQSVAQFYGLNDATLIHYAVLVDSDQAIDWRCLQYNGTVLHSLGLTSSFSDTSSDKKTAFPSFLNEARYSETDIEMFRILYSPLMTPGLSEEEIRRRLN